MAGVPVSYRIINSCWCEEWGVRWRIGTRHVYLIRSCDWCAIRYGQDLPKDPSLPCFSHPSPSLLGGVFSPLLSRVVEMFVVNKHLTLFAHRPESWAERLMAHLTQLEKRMSPYQKGGAPWRHRFLLFVLEGLKVKNILNSRNRNH